MQLIARNTLGGLLSQKEAMDIDVDSGVARGRSPDGLRRDYPSCPVITFFGSTTVQATRRAEGRLELIFGVTPLSVFGRSSGDDLGPTRSFQLPATGWKLCYKSTLGLDAGSPVPDCYLAIYWQSFARHAPNA